MQALFMYVNLCGVQCWIVSHVHLFSYPFPYYFIC